MKTALIIHQSKKGTTSQFGKEIGSFLETLGIKTEIQSIANCQIEDASQYDYLFLGCWTKGLMVVGQHPDKEWKSLARRIQIPDSCGVVLFTTYKIATGSMFSKMKKNLQQKSQKKILKLKSKDGRFSDLNAWMLDQYINSTS